MANRFHLLDLTSQAPAVQRLLRGRSSEQKLAWLKDHGRLAPVPIPRADARPHYLFESAIGFQCIFFMLNDKFVFLGDNAAYTVGD